MNVGRALQLLDNLVLTSSDDGVSSSLELCARRGVQLRERGVSIPLARQACFCTSHEVFRAVPRIVFLLALRCVPLYISICALIALCSDANSAQIEKEPLTN